MSPLLNRLAALGLTMVVIAGLVLGVALPLRAYYTDLTEEIADLKAQHARFADRLATLTPAAPVVVDEVAVFEAESEAVGAALIQERVAEIIAESGSALRRMRAGSSSGQGANQDAPSGLVLLPVSIEADTTITGLQEILHAIDAARPYLTVALVEVRRAGRAADDREQEISLRLDVVGYMPAPNGS
ncbi:MAG: type II secretion system protein GspM [Pseudomonadota bacterium]